MATDLTSLQSQVASGLQGTYTDYLKDKRNLAKARSTASERFAGSFGPQGESGAVVNPADIFRSYQTFQTAVPSVPEQLAYETDLMKQITELGSQGDGLEEVERLLGIRKQLEENDLDTSVVDAQLGSLGKPSNKSGEDEVRGVNAIDRILGQSTQSSTGLLKFGIFNPYETAQVRTDIKQLQGLLELAEAGKLKGQGTITENERKILRNAVSYLGIDMEKGTTDLKDSTFRTRLGEFRTALAKKSGRPELLSSDSGVGTTAPGGFIIEKIEDQGA